MLNRHFRCSAAGLLSALLLAGCGRRDEASVGTPENPLVVLLSPSHAPAGREPLDFIAKRLSAETGMTVSVFTASTPIQAIEDFGAGRADAGILTVDEYLLAREEYGVHAALQALRRGAEHEFAAVLLGRAEGDPKDVPGLAHRKVAFADPTSLSGFLLPAAFLLKAGVEVQTEFTGGHDESVRRLLAGKVDAAATYAEMAVRHKGLRILAQTGMAPNEPFVVRRGLNPDKRRALVAAIQSLAGTEEGEHALGALADISGWRPIDEDVYRPIHDTLRALDKSVYDLVPQGWEIRRLNQPYLPD
ncbi:MAG: hypothetical protein A2X36_03760 [Elusimicrobia bacterium GWA2_69_24]|nr:MAG: hypothetical protein A2X36_03760 [Elusimicrobia bacterium GWA2_69_24]HBL15946.1 hypothetical protein [Elusimicrobiota bacterium]